MVSITYSELKALRDNSQLTPGMQYRITDYQCTTVQSDTASANHQFDIIVVADSSNTLNENARAGLHEGDTYFANNNLKAWQLKYLIDNDDTRYRWVNSTSGKGVIYWMKDEFDNECPYDFKNITRSWTVSGTTISGLYTFCNTSNGVKIDGSLNTLIRNNVIGPCFWNYKYEIPKVCFYASSRDASSVVGNIIKEVRNRVIFFADINNSGCNNNYIRSGKVTLGNSCSYNDIDGDSGVVTLGNSCSKNIISGYPVTLGNNCYGNEIYISSTHQTTTTTLGDSCSYNKLIRCHSITLNANSEYNVFGYCHTISFTGTAATSASLSYCTFDSYIFRVQLEVTGSSYSKYHFHGGIMDKTIKLTMGTSGSIDVYANKSEEVYI